MDGPASSDPVAMLALLADPNRRRLYDLVAMRQAPVGRDDAAAALGISRELAAFHLDRLVDGGLLEAEYRRLTGRTGPGAGRPAKLYRRAAGDLSVSFPPRDYERAAEVFAAALERLERQEGVDASGAVAAVARRRGLDVGRGTDPASASAPGEDGRGVLLDLLRAAGFEPLVDPTDGAIRLRNCPYRLLSEQQRELTCGMNLAWASGVLDGLHERAFAVELDPEPGRCCVVFRPASRPPDAPPVRRRTRRGTG
jgi:predicted ArsR family transcriptional regulator